MSVFQDRVIVVTGASEGIGRAVCLALASQQPRLVLAASNRERLGALKVQVESQGARVIAAPTDVSQEAHCRALIQKAVDTYGAIDVLVNNAGRTMWRRLAEMAAPSVTENLMRTNYLITSRRGRLGRWIKLLAPTLVDRIALKAILEKR